MISNDDTFSEVSFTNSEAYYKFEMWSPDSFEEHDCFVENISEQEDEDEVKEGQRLPTSFIANTRKKYWNTLMINLPYIRLI